MKALLDPHAAEFWVMIAFLCFVALLIRYNVPGMVAKALDDRADAIRNELDEARRLRQEAEALLADYQKRTRAADEEARSIIEESRREAEAMRAETRKSLAESIERRTKIAEDKIARAEAQAVSEVRAAAIDKAVAAAETILKGRVAGESGAGLIDQSIRDLRQKLN